MDEEGYMLLQQLKDEEEEMVQDSQMRMAVVLAVVHVGAEEAHQLHVQCCQPFQICMLAHPGRCSTAVAVTEHLLQQWGLMLKPNPGCWVCAQVAVDNHPSKGYC